MGNQKRCKRISVGFLDQHDFAAGVVVGLDVGQREITVQKDAVGVLSTRRIACKDGAFHRCIGRTLQIAPGRCFGRRNKILHKIRGCCQLRILRLIIKRAYKSVDLMAFHLVKRHRLETCRLAEGDIRRISAAHRPVVVGTEVEVILLLLLNLAVRIHRLDLFGELGVNKFDVLLFAGGDALIFFGQIKLNRGRRNQAVYLHAVQILGIGADYLRIAFGHLFAGAEDLHSHIAVQKQIARLLAAGALASQTVAWCIGVLIGFIVDGRCLCLLI